MCSDRCRDCKTYDRSIPVLLGRQCGTFSTLFIVAANNCILWPRELPPPGDSAPQGFEVSPGTKSKAKGT